MPLRLEISSTEAFSDTSLSKESSLFISFIDEICSLVKTIFPSLVAFPSESKLYISPSISTSFVLLSSFVSLEDSLLSEVSFPVTEELSSFLSFSSLEDSFSILESFTFTVAGFPIFTGIIGFFTPPFSLSILILSNYLL